MDILLWPDGTWVYREDYSWAEWSWLGDDYEIVTRYSPKWHELTDGEFKDN